MKKLRAILTALLPVLSAACYHQPASEVIMLRDTVIANEVQLPPPAAHAEVQPPAVQSVVDSADINIDKIQEQLREQYSQRQTGYLRELVRMDSLVALLWDGIDLLINEIQRLQAEVSELQQRLALASAPAPSTPTPSEVQADNEPTHKTALRRIRSQWLLDQPRTIYTIGADDKVGEVEVTNTCIYNNDMYITVEVAMEKGVENVTASMNGTAAPYQYVAKKGRVFAFALPKLSGTVRLEFLVDGRTYTIKTNVKNLI